MKLKPEIKVRWIAALLSKLYVQGTRVLKGNGCHCCIGVLGDLAVQDGVALWDPILESLIDPKGIGCPANHGLPEWLAEWAFKEEYLEEAEGLGEIEFNLPADCEVLQKLQYYQRSLTGANDIAELDFEAISKLIDEFF